MKIFLNWLFRKIPIPLQMWIGDLLGILWIDILRIRRDVALDNLSRCYPEWSLEEKLRVARKSTQNLGRAFVEFCRVPFVQHEDVIHFTIRGREHLESARARGRGVFLLTQHIGNGDWAIVGLALNGIQVHVITKQFKIKFLNDLWFKLRTRLGTVLIADRNTSYAILKALKKNALVAYMLDQFMGPPIGVRTRFFGRETGTPMGLAVLTGRSKAAVVPVVTYRDDQGHTYIEFGPEIPFVEQDTPDKTIEYMTQVYCDKIEQYVRQFPEQWMWVHRRWKPFRT